jgi:mRNA interferase MazF
MVKKSNFPKRGDIYWVNLNPTIGVEINKTRPALIVSNDIANEMAQIIIVAPITSKIKTLYPFEVKVTLNGKDGKIMLNQCRAIDKSRLAEKIASLDLEIMKLVEDAIKIAFGLS